MIAGFGAAGGHPDQGIQGCAFLRRKSRPARSEPVTDQAKVRGILAQEDACRRRRFCFRRLAVAGGAIHLAPDAEDTHFAGVGGPVAIPVEEPDGVGAAVGLVEFGCRRQWSADRMMLRTEGDLVLLHRHRVIGTVCGGVGGGRTEEHNKSRQDAPQQDPRRTPEPPSQANAASARAAPAVQGSHATAM